MDMGREWVYRDGMTSKEARERIRFAGFLRDQAGIVERDARDGCDVPRPGAIVQHAGTGRIYRVVEVNGFGRTLDTLGDEGIWKCRVADWTPYDVLQDGLGGSNPADVNAKEEGMAYREAPFLAPKTEEDLAALAELNKQPEFKAALGRAEKKGRK